MVPLLHVAAAVLHQAAPAATFDCHRCYIKPVPLLHVGLPLLHQATNMLHVAATAGTCDRRHCYTKLLMLLHADDAAATSGRQRATCGHRHCYIPVPPSLHQAAGVLHAATAVATCRSRCCFLVDVGDVASGRRYQGIAGGVAGEGSRAAMAGGAGVRRWLC
jgi:hypothetical protein